MKNFDTVVLDGEMGLFTKVREGDLPYYTGATEVTPSDSTQVLETADTIVTENITINPIPDMDLEEVQVTYTPDEEGQTDTITPSTGYVGIAEVEVTVEPIDSNYVGSGIARKDSDDLTASGATVIAPAGYYEEAAMKSVASGSAATPDTSITANPTISVGNDGSITASVSATQSVTPSVTAGYVSAGTAGNITVSGSGSAQLSTQAAATITPSTQQQTAVAAGKFTTGNVVVDPMPSGTAGTPTATKGTVINHSVAVTPSVTNTEGYISGGTHTGTAVTVSASELVSGSQNITSNDTYDVTNLASVTVAVPGETPTLQTKSVSYTPTESQQTAAVTPDTGYDGLDQVNVTVGAIDSEYVGSDVPRRSSSDLSASGATVTAPAGYYESAATKSVASGTAGTPSATKGAVSNHSVSVTPSVTNTAGYISGGTISGTAVTVDVTELESGTKSITENGTGISVSGYSTVDVNVSGGGGGGAEKKQVSFFDYDGTIYDSYTKAEAQALSALPSNPSHAGLTAQGWNWTLEAIKSFLTKYPNTDVNVGQMYTTASGATEIDVTLDSSSLNPYLNIAVNGTVSIDWGDNSTPDTVTGTSETTNIFTAHTYAAPGDYTISITVTSGKFRFNAVPLSHTNSTSTGQKYIDTITAIRIGTGTTYIGNLNNLYYLETITLPNTITDMSSAFWTCVRLKSVTIPTSMTSVPGNCFRNCRGLESLLLPHGLTNISAAAFQECVSLQYVTLPDTLTSLGSYGFAANTNLKSITIPGSVTMIDHNTFNGCWSLQNVDIPSGVTSIKTAAFVRCYPLGDVTIPSDVTEITQSAFEECNAMQTITIPSSVTSIAAAAFKNCYVAEIHILPTTPPTLSNSNAFTMKPDTVVYVPYSADHSVLATYQTASNWSSYASYMQEASA